MDELKKASRQRGVCVDHLKRCKTSYSFNLVQFYFVLAGGTGVTLVPVPTKTARSHSDIKGRRPFDVPASNFMFVAIFCYRTWLTQEPPSRFKQLPCFPISRFARFSQSERAASEPLEPSSKDVERFPSHFLVSNHPYLACQVLLDCLCT